MDSSGSQTETWTYDQYNREVTHTDLDGNTAWEVYDNSPQWGTQTPGTQGRLIAEYRYGPGVFTQQMLSEAPSATPWAERTVYVYDDGVTDPSAGYSLPAAERLRLGRVAEGQVQNRL